ncbi:30S ribosomal protein S16 [Spiroplasma endosymbiont of 'Nebria riversi']|uniref:30S ribosomal protein S16 n=1 Tax=Spiroplasma endosymbiont of 'Nebria riversi' TaxID=2792084 RepID=UPI001C0456BE|nr:30S ribosomal protein S16 [Spiroplasma endosymbiont of 'Nebria riversi']
MVKLRLKRTGRTKQPFYRVVAIDSRIKRDGEYIELIGTYDSLNDSLKINKELALKWLTFGAQPTETVRSLFAKEKIMQAFHELRQKNKAKKSTAEKKVIKKEHLAKEVKNKVNDDKSSNSKSTVKVSKEAKGIDKKNSRE